MLKAVASLVAAVAMAGTASAVEPASKTSGVASFVYDCPTPPGKQAEFDRRMDVFVNTPPEDSYRNGWYATLPAPQRVLYSTVMPVRLDLADTPYLVGVQWGGRDYGDIVDRRMVCGHSLETHDWNVLVHAYGDGFATIDVREMLADEPLPQAEGNHTIPAHDYAFDIAGTRYKYVVGGVTVGLVKVWRPDLVEMSNLPGMPQRVPDSGDPDTVWPILDSYRGVLLTSGLPEERQRPADGPTVRDAAAIEGALMGRGMLMFGVTEYEQPVDLTGTSWFHGGFGGVNLDHPGQADPESPIEIDSEGEEIIFFVRGRSKVRVDLGEWFDRQLAGITTWGSLKQVPITSPLVEFDYEGTKVKYVVTSLTTTGLVVDDGRASFTIERFGGEVFADQPLF